MGSILTISDVTRMSGTNVCIAGYLEDGSCVRPQLKYGHITEDWLYVGGAMACRPFAQIDVEFLPGLCSTRPPHTEDRFISAAYRVVGHLSDPGERQGFLARICQPSLREAFGTELLTDGASPKRFVHPGSGTRSLAVVKGNVTFLEFGESRYREGQRSYEIAFCDSTGTNYRTAITDLALRAYLDNAERGMGSSASAAVRLGESLESCDVWLRVGFARGWDRGGATEERCYLQLNGLYSIPDYLDGRCYGDFAPAPQSALRQFSSPPQHEPRGGEEFSWDVDDIPF